MRSWVSSPRVSDPGNHQKGTHRMTGTRIPLIPCSGCGLAFKASREQREAHAAGRRVYHTRACQKGDGFVTVTCAAPDCGKEVKRRRCDLAESGRAFCNGECRNKTPKPKTGRYLPCEVCEEPMWVIPALEGKKKTCSAECRDKRNSTKEERPCENCGETFLEFPSMPTKFCSRKCYGIAKRAKPGDRCVDRNTGYAWLYVDDGEGGVLRVQEHRWVMEQHIGRALHSWETVHHKREGFKGRSNNDLNNLELWPSRHPRGHRVEDIVAYCRGMLALYGDDLERSTYAGAEEGVISGAVAE